MSGANHIEHVIVRASSREIALALDRISRDPVRTIGGRAKAIHHGARACLILNAPWTEDRDNAELNAGDSLWHIRRAHRVPVRLNSHRWMSESPTPAGLLELLVCDDRRLWGAYWPPGGPPVHQITLKSAPQAAILLGDDRYAAERPAALPRTSGIFGSPSQARAWKELEVAVIGAGRTGSLLADALSSQGVRRITLIDGDMIETGNLDGMALVAASSVGATKVHALGSSLVLRFPDIAVTGIWSAFPSIDAIGAIAAADVLITATDSDEPRLIAASMAQRLMQTHIDVGTSTDRLTRASGADVRVCVPEDRCLVCLGGVASAGGSRARRPGTSTRLINAVAAHLAIELLAGILNGTGVSSRWVRIEAEGGSGRLLTREVPREEAGSNSDCPCCGNKPNNSPDPMET